MKRLTLKFIICLCVALGATSLPAAIKYWDIDGATAGAGGATPGGAWTGSTWSTDPAGAGATTTFTAGDSAVFSAGADATGAFTVSGNATAASILIEEGTVTISGTITLGAGTVTVNSGATLSTDSSARISATAGSVYTVNGGTLRTTNPGAAGSFVDVDSVIVLNGGGTLSHTAAGVLNIVQTTTIISGSGPLTKTGAGILAIASPCTYSGATIINDGTLRIRGSSNRLPTGTDVTINSPGVFDPGQSQTVRTVNGNGATTFSGSTTLTINGGAGFDSTITGIISDGASFGNITKSGAGILTLGGVNTYDGTFTLSAGTCTVNSGATLCGSVCDVVVSGGTLNLNNSLQVVENLTGTGGTIVLGSGHTLSVGPVANGTYAGTIAGSGGLIKTNTSATVASLTLSGANTYSGSTAVNAGKLFTTTASTGAGSHSAADNTTLGVKVASAGGSLNVSGLTLGSSSTNEFDLADLGFSGSPVVNDTGTIAVNGTVTVNAKGFNSNGTATLLQHAGARSGVGSFVNGTFPPHLTASITDDTVNKRVVLNVSAADSLVWVSDGSGNWNVNTAANTIWKLATAGTATFYQETAVQGDTVRFDDTATVTTTVSIPATVSPFKVTVDNSSQNYTLSGVGKISGVASLIKSGTGQLTILTTNDFTGGTTLNAGTVITGNNSPLGTGKLTINGGAIRSDSTTARTLSVPVDLNGNVTLGDAVNNGALTFSTGAWSILGGTRQIGLESTAVISSVIAGGGLTKAGNGTLDFGTQANTYSGGFNHNAGTVRVNATTSLGAANSAVMLADGVTLSTTAGTARTLTYGWTINGNITLGQVSGGTAAVTLAGTVDLGGGPRTITVSNTTDTISGVISNGGLTKEGPGILQLGNAANTYSGTTTINAGTLNIDSDASIGDGTGDLVFNGGDLQTTGDRDTIAAPNNITLAADAKIKTTSTAAAADVRFTGTLGGSAGTLTLTNSGADAATDVFLVWFGGSGFTFNRPIVIENGAVGNTQLNFNNSSGTQTFNGFISGSGSVRRNAVGGVTVLGGVNTYTNTTTITAGTLEVDGSLNAASAVTVGSAGILSGTGTVAGTVNLSGTIAPGGSVGTLSTGPETWNGGGTNQWELINANGIAGTGWDLLSVNGGIDVQATSGNKFTVKVISLNGAGGVGSVTNLNNDNAYIWPIVSTTDSVTNYDAASFNVDFSSVSNDLAGGEFVMDAASLSVRFTNNHPPVAGTAFFSRPRDTTLKIKIADLLAASTSDPDGDARALAAVNASSTNGLNNVTSDATFIYYTPGANGNVTDALGYTVRDVRAAYRAVDTVRQASGTIVVTLAPDSANQTQNIVSISTNIDGNFTITFAGIPGRSYLVQAVTNLAPPVTWQTLSTNAAGTNGLWSFTDLEATNYAQRFYRSAKP